MTKRKNHSADFKAKVAPEAIREEMTMAELSKKYGVHATQICTWKRAALQNMASAFTGRGGDPGPAISTAEIDKLQSVNRQGMSLQAREGKIGQLVVERDFLTPLGHASLHCRAVDASVQLLGTRGKNGEQGPQVEHASSMQAAEADPVQSVLSS